MRLVELEVHVPTHDAFNQREPVACQEEMSRPQLQERSRPGLLVGQVPGSGENHFLAAGAAAAELEGVDLVSLSVGENCFDVKLAWSVDAAVLEGVDLVSLVVGENCFDGTLDWCIDE